MSRYGACFWPTHLAGRLLLWRTVGWLQLRSLSHPQEFLVTLRLQRATLRHYMSLPEQSWHSQVSNGAVGGQVSRQRRPVGGARAGLQLTSGWS